MKTIFALKDKRKLVLYHSLKVFCLSQGTDFKQKLLHFKKILKSQLILDFDKNIEKNYLARNTTI